MNHDSLKDTFIQNALYRLNESTRMLEKAIVHISNKDLWKQPNQNTNSIGNLILHLCGNLTQYGFASLGNEPDTRNREAEFILQPKMTKVVLLEKLHGVLNKVMHTIQMCSDADWVRQRQVQGFNLSGVGIVMHIVEHYSYHTGQIALLTKLFHNVDLGFYDGFDLNTKNA